MFLSSTKFAMLMAGTLPYGTFYCIRRYASSFFICKRFLLDSSTSFFRFSCSLMPKRVCMRSLPSSSSVSALADPTAIRASFTFSRCKSCDSAGAWCPLACGFFTIYLR